MREAIRILRQELAFCTQSSELLEKLEKLLKENASGNGVSETARSLEKALAEAPKLDAANRAFLEAAGQPDMKSFLEAQAPSMEKDMALKLWKQVASQQEKLWRQSSASRLLLERSKEFIDFQINVLSRTQASPVYGPPGTEGGENQRGRRLFDQNV